MNGGVPVGDQLCEFPFEALDQVNEISDNRQQRIKDTPMRALVFLQDEKPSGPFSIAVELMAPGSGTGAFESGYPRHAL